MVPSSVPRVILCPLAAEATASIAATTHNTYDL
jgi:hypothetical protein